MFHASFYIIKQEILTQRIQNVLIIGFLLYFGHLLGIYDFSVRADNDYCP